MHPNMKRLLGLDGVKPIFHQQTWPKPVDIPADKPVDIPADKEGK